MKPDARIQQRIAEVGGALAQALGERVVCVAVYGSAAGDDFSPGHSDVNLLLAGAWAGAARAGSPAAAAGSRPW